MDAGFGQSLASSHTTADRTADGYVLNGVKAVVPLASRRTHFLVVARCDNSSDAFIVPRETPGLRLGIKRHPRAARAGAG